MSLERRNQLRGLIRNLLICLCCKTYTLHLFMGLVNPWKNLLWVWGVNVVMRATTCPHVFIVWGDNTWCKGLTSFQLESLIYGLSCSDIYQLLWRKTKTTQTKVSLLGRLISVQRICCLNASGTHLCTMFSTPTSYNEKNNVIIVYICLATAVQQQA